MQENEAIWLERAQRGDDEAFANIVESYQRPVFNLCYRMLGDAREAEDAAQETFIRAYRSIRRYDSTKPFASWLLAIAAHYCIDLIRKRKLSLVSVEEMGYVELSDGTPGPEASLSMSEEQNRVRSLLRHLGPVDRAAVVMFYWYDFSYEEIAESLDISISAVKSRLHRARREMALKWTELNDQIHSVEMAHHGEHSPAF